MQRMRLLMVTSGVQPTQENLPQFQQRSPAFAGRRAPADAGAASGREGQKIDDHLDRSGDRRADRGHRPGQQHDARAADAAAAGARRRDRHPAKAQIRADSSWQAWISGRYGSRLRIGDDQIKAFERRQAEAASKPQYQVSEVFIDAGRVGGMEVGRERRQATDHPDAAGRALPGRGPPVLGLADRRQRRRRRLGQPRRNAARGRHGARAAASRPAVRPDPGARRRLHHLSARQALGREDRPGRPEAGRRGPAQGRRPAPGRRRQASCSPT